MDATVLDAFVRRHRLTVNTLVQGAWALLLSRYTGTDDLAFGVTISGRPGDLPGVERIVGLFINTLPLRINVMPGQAVSDWLRHLLVHQTELVEHQYSPLAQVQRWSDVPAGTPLFDSIVVFENYPTDLSNAAAMTRTIQIDDIRAIERTNYPLTLELAIGQRLSLKLIYDTDRFEREAIERLTGHLGRLLDGMVAEPDRLVSELSLLDAEERQQLLAGWNDPTVSYRQQACLHDLFAAQAARTPDAVAVVFEDQEISYGELERRSNQLAHHLQKLGVGPDTVVGLLAKRSIELVIGLLGILKAGGAYLPLDPDTPQDRIARADAACE
jgi:non-ribosomal peptide synthetase component F